MFWRKSIDARLRDDVKALTDRLDKLERVIPRLLEDFETLDVKHEKLKSAVYRYKLHKPEEETPEEKPLDKMSRQELRAHLFHSGRFMPGKPVKHD